MVSELTLAVVVANTPGVQAAGREALVVTEEASALPDDDLNRLRPVFVFAETQQRPHLIEALDHGTVSWEAIGATKAHQSASALILQRKYLGDDGSVRLRLHTRGGQHAWAYIPPLRKDEAPAGSILENNDELGARAIAYSVFHNNPPRYWISRSVKSPVASFRSSTLKASPNAGKT